MRTVRAHNLDIFPRGHVPLKYRNTLNINTLFNRRVPWINTHFTRLHGQGRLDRRRQHGVVSEMTLCPAGVLDRIAGPNWTSTLCRIGVPHASVLNALVFSSARDFAAGATEALRWTYELCRVGVLHGSVLNALVFTGARLCGRRYQRQSSPLALRRTKIFHSHLLTTLRSMRFRPM